MYAFLQIALSMSFNFNITFPQAYSETTGTFRTILFDVVPELGLQCWIEGFDYVDKLFTVSIFPILASACIGIVAFLRRTFYAHKGASVEFEAFCFFLLTFIK